MINAKWMHASIIVLLVAGCSDAGFNGSDAIQKKALDHSGSKDKNSSDATSDADGDSGIDVEKAEDEAESKKSVTADDVREILQGDPNAETLAACLEGWGNDTGLTADAVRKYRTLKADATGFSSSQIDDRTSTKAPSLVLIESAATGFSSIEMNLGNPNGYYCLKGTNLGFSGRKIMKHCRAVIGSDSVSNTGFSGSSISEYGSECG